MDITEIILADHEEQRRMFARIDEVDQSDTQTLRVLWNRLSAMLEVHAEAEEVYFYPELLKLGERLKDIGTKIGLSLISSTIFQALKSHFGIH